MNLPIFKHVATKLPPPFLQPFRNCQSKAKKMQSTTDYCVNLVRLNEHENFMCTLLLSGEVRQAAFAVRAFNIEIAKVSDQAKEKHINAMRMKFWSDTLDSIYNKNPPKHPVALELSRVVSKHNLIKKNLKRLITARADMVNLRFSSIDEMEKYCEETVSPIYYLILQAAGCKSIEADHLGSHLGKAQGLSTLLRSVPHNITSRSLPLPSNLLASHSVSQESVLRGEMSSDLGEVVYEVASAAKIHLNKARSLKDSVNKEYNLIFLPAIAVDSYLEKLRYLDFDIFNPWLQKRNSSLGFKLYWNKMRNTF